MKKYTASVILFIISILCAAAFAVKTIADYFRYDPIVNSAPFYVWIIINALYFLIPSAISLTAGIIIRKNLQKYRSEQEK